MCITAQPRPGGGLAIDVTFPRQPRYRPAGRMPNAPPARRPCRSIHSGLRSGKDGAIQLTRG
jgi:hypothetical protein